MRRRANIACAEHAFALMLTLARRIHRINGLNSIEQLGRELAVQAVRPQTYAGRQLGAHWRNLQLNGSTIGIIGLGEIGPRNRLARHRVRNEHPVRTPLPPGEEATLGVSYRPLHALLAQSDWVVPQLPGDPSTRNFIDRGRLALMKPGACLINVSRAEVVERMPSSRRSAQGISAVLPLTRPMKCSAARMTSCLRSTT